MRFITCLLALAILFSVALPSAYAQDTPDKLLEEAKDLFAKKKWARSLNKLKLAQQLEIPDIISNEIALYIGGIYAEMGQDSLALQNFKKYLHDDATVSKPDSFTDKMSVIFEKARLSFPLISDIKIEKSSFKPYREKLAISFNLKADSDTAGKTEVKLSHIGAVRNESLLETLVKIDTASAKQIAGWDGKDKYGKFMENGDYVILLEAVRKDGWKSSASINITIGGNTGTQEVKTLKSKSRRIESLEGQKRIEYIPGKQFVKVGLKPLKSDMTGFWNYFYYIPWGALRDGLDYPVKALLSTKYVGHALTATAPFIGGYTVGESMTSLKRGDYYDPVMGFDEDSWNHDKDVASQRAVASGVLGPVWGLTYAGIMSVVSWAGTDEGISKGFKSYINSNAFRNGYDSKYFFPNYHSLDFSTVRVDEDELEKLETKVRQTNLSIRKEIEEVNRETDSFNRQDLVRFKRDVTNIYNKKLFDLAEITIKVRK